MALDITAILSEFGAIYRKENKQAINALMKMLMVASETEQYFRLTPTDSTILERASVEQAAVLQAFQTAFTPKGTTTFKPRKIPLFWQKIDASIIPHELQKSWLGFLHEKGLDPMKTPIVPYWLSLLISQMKEDMELDEIFWGVHADPTPGTASAVRTTMDGIRKQINDGITAGTVFDVALGAVSSDPATHVTYVEQLIDAMPEELRTKTDFVFMNKTLYRRYRQGMRAKYNLHYQQEDLDMVVDTNIKVVGLQSHTGSDKIWTTPAFNRARGVKNGKQETIFDLQKSGREVQALQDHHRGVGFWIPEYVYTNDVDLV